MSTESVDSSQGEWENDYYIPTMATHTMHTEEYDEDYEEERAIEQRATLDEEDRLLHRSSWKKKSPSIDRYGSTSIDTQPHQPNHLRASTDNAYFPLIDTNVDATRDGDYSIVSWADNRYHESNAVETAYRDQGDDELNEGFIYDELLNMQRRDEADQNRAASAWERTHFSHPIDRESRPSIDTNHSQLIDINNTTSIDNHILQTTNGADNLFIHQCNIPEHQQKESYDTTSGINKSFKQGTRYPTQPSIDVDVPTSVDKRPEFGRRAFDLLGSRRFYWEEKDEDEPSYICLPEHASSFTQTKLVSEIYTKDEINEMFYGVCGKHEKNKKAFQMKLDGVYYPLNDSISWMTNCMEEMKQEITIIQSATDVARPTSIDNRLHTSIDSRLRTSIDNRIPAWVDDNPPQPHSIKSQPDFHTRAEIDHIVDGIYRDLESTEEKLDGRCDDIYFPMDLSISALTSKIEAIQGELVEIQSYIACQPEASPSIDRRNNKSTNIHQHISVDKASNRGRLVKKITIDISDTHNHREEIAADTYA
ncbi:hypothetical protein F2Q70_00021522 [Brassica cretica]|uniref:Uncharacterized protein n=1 Tax=Brassica cretica TaxID=69181 RepID=A0A8S9GN35_BRACR|nr:hypothetical protein F2Q70_00021522 [Brassica cretica]